MKKLTRFLIDWGILIQIAVVIVWVFWALQLSGPIKSTISEEIQYQKTRDAEKERQAFQELNAMGIKLGDEAEALGENYTPEKYFKDLLALYQKGAEGNINPGVFHTGPILKVSMDNLNKGIVTHAEIQTASKEFTTWNENRISHRDELKAPTWEGLKNWSLTFYLRTILLITIFYLVRMADRRGILETILADKTKCILAIVFWPVYLTKYPYNVIREIRVEAELRRFKDLFRKLSPKELRLVREIANSSNYTSWLNQRRSYNRGLFITLTITIIFHIFATPVRAQTQVSKVMKIVSVQNYQQITEDSFEENHQTETAMLPNPPLLEPLLFIVTVKFAKETWKSITKEPPIVIPRNALFGTVTKITNQIRRYNNEITKRYTNHSFTSFNQCICS